MGQGQDRIAQSLLELEPTAIVEFFQLYFNTVDKPSSYIAFHGGSVFQKGIVWQGIEYLPIPVETEGFEVNANGRLARPKIRVSNKDYFVTDLLLENDDLQFAKLIRRRTFVKYLDDVNFDGGNPWGLADASAEVSVDTFVIGQKTVENKVFVEFELTSPLDLESFEVNNRLIMSRYCSWYYRGNGCNYRDIPLATEDGRNLNVNFDSWKVAQQWQEGKVYASGDPTYLENTKITVSNPQNPAEKSFAKIWYVCKQNHTGASANKPDINQNFWDKDGCNKKLDGCKLRFGKGASLFNNTVIQSPETFVDFTQRTGNFRYNNIALAATVSVSSAPTTANFINDLQTGTNSNWLSSARPTGLVNLTWDSPVNLQSIHVYDHNSTNNNLNNAVVTYFNASNSVLGSGILRPIPTNGNPIGTGVNTSFSIKRVQISGYSGSTSYNIGLGEVAAIEANVPYLVYQDNLATPLHRQDYFHIATKITLSGRSLFPNEIYSIYHNIGNGTGTRYSGINLYLSGNNLCLDFATRRTGQLATAPSLVTGITLPWNDDSTYTPIHLICEGGVANGSVPTSSSAGFISLSYGDRKVEYTLNNLSGEYFLFKNSNYQNGIGSSNNRLEFGINDWRYPQSGSLGSFPTAPVGQITSGLVVYSPISFGTTAIWTGSFGVEDRIKEYNEIPNRYERVSGRSSVTNNLLGWWDMEFDVNKEILAENNSSVKLVVTGNVSSTNQSIKYFDETISEKINQPKQSEILPFGGFPGTEKYG